MDYLKSFYKNIIKRTQNNIISEKSFILPENDFGLLRNYIFELVEPKLSYIFKFVVISVLITNIIPNFIFAKDTIIPPIYSSSIISDSVNIVLIGDPQRTLWVEVWRENNDTIRQKLFENVCREKPSEIILLGDMVNFGSDESEWAYFDTLTYCLREKHIPFFPILGNHDYYGINNKAMRNFHRRFQNRNYSNYYSFIKDSIAFIMLNSNFDDLDRADIRSQNRFLDSAVKSFEIDSGIKFVVACWHHPPFTNSKIVDDDDDSQREFLPRLKFSRKLKIIASGHAHTYEHFIIDSVNYVVSGGGGGPRQGLKPKYRHEHFDMFHGSLLREFHYSKIIKRNGSYFFQMVAFDEKTEEFIVKDEWTIYR